MKSIQLTLVLVLAWACAETAHAQSRDRAEYFAPDGTYVVSDVWGFGVDVKAYAAYVNGQPLFGGHFRATAGQDASVRVEGGFARNEGQRTFVIRWLRWHRYVGGRWTSTEQIVSRSFDEP